MSDVYWLNYWKNYSKTGLIDLMTEVKFDLEIPTVQELCNEIGQKSLKN